MKILLLEDDVRIAEALASDLTEQHYVVDIASDGQAGLELVEAFSYDLLIANAMLPKLSGISLCERLRSCGYSLPVMMLSDQDVSQQKVKKRQGAGGSSLVGEQTPYLKSGA